MSDHYPTVLSPLARFANFAGGGLKSRVKLTEKYLLDRARKLTGLDDFGETDFLAHLRILLESFETEADLSLTGRLLTQRDLQRCLTNRLCIRKFFEHHPETDAVPVPDPVVITGFPRAGTTFLHRLLAQDPETRVLRSWELFVPVSADGVSAGTRDARRGIVVRSARRAGMLLISRRGRRRLKAIHDTSPDAPEECWPLLQNAFLSEVFGLGARTPTYSRYVADADFTGAYRYYRRQLQILTLAAPARRLVVKYPGHLGHLEDLVRVFPGARIIWCHRDPIEVFASICSLIATGRSVRSDRVDPIEIGKGIMEYGKHRLNSALAVRESLGEDRFVDIMYKDLTADPLATVRRIYDALGFPLPEETESLIASYVAENRRRRRSASHRYSAATFGIDSAIIQPQLRQYCERFGL